MTIQHDARHGECFSDSTHDPRYLKVMIMHDESGAKKRAVRLLEKIRGRLEGDFEIHAQLFDSSLLEKPEEFRGALASSDNADILIVAMNGTRPFPSSVESWLKLCARRKEGTHTAIVALLERNESPGNHSPGLKFLEETVSLSHLDFFALEMTSRSPLDSIASLLTKTGPGLGVLTPYTGWGLNE